MVDLVKPFHVRRGCLSAVCPGHDNRRIGHLAQSAAVIPDERHDFSAIFLDEIRSRNEVLRPRSGFVRSGSAMHAETNEHIAGLHGSIELFEEYAIESNIVRQGADERCVVAKRSALETLFPLSPREFRDVTRQMTRVCRASSVATREDRAVVFPSFEQGFDDRREVRSAGSEGNFSGFFEVSVDEVLGGGHCEGL